jgi:hypothetical protein
MCKIVTCNEQRVCHVWCMPASHCKTFLIPYLNTLGKKLILITVFWMKICGPCLTADWNSNKCCSIFFTQNDDCTSVCILHWQMSVHTCMYLAGNREVLAICWLQAGDYYPVCYLWQQNTDRKTVCDKLHNVDIVQVLSFRQWLFTVLSGLLNFMSVYKVSDIFHLQESTSVLNYLHLKNYLMLVVTLTSYCT